MIDALFEVARVGADQDGLRRWLDRVGWVSRPTIATQRHTNWCNVSLNANKSRLEILTTKSRGNSEKRESFAACHQGVE